MEKVLDAVPFNIDAFLLRGTCVSPTQLNTCIWKKMIVTPPWIA
jgi:hypothetical protein